MCCSGGCGLCSPSCAHHDSIMDESTSVPGRSQVWVFLCACYLDAPNRFPCLIELCVDRINPRMMGGYSIAQVCGPILSLLRIIQQQFPNWSQEDRVRRNLPGLGNLRYFLHYVSIKIERAILYQQECSALGTAATRTVL